MFIIIIINFDSFLEVFYSFLKAFKAYTGPSPKATELLVPLMTPFFTLTLKPSRRLLETPKMSTYCQVLSLGKAKFLVV